MADDILEGRFVEQRAGKNMQRVEPATSLVDVLDDEVGRVVLLEPLFVLEGIVHLCERHGAGLEPAVEYFGNSAHHGRTGRIVRVRSHEFVDVGAMQIRRPDTEVGFEFVEAAVDIDSWIVGVVASPHRDG